MATTAPCRSCGEPRPPRLYLCPTCWRALPGPTRNALNRRDDRAVRRAADLYEQIRRDVPLSEIRITEPTPENQ